MLAWVCLRNTNPMERVKQDVWCKKKGKVAHYFGAYYLVDWIYWLSHPRYITKLHVSRILSQHAALIMSGANILCAIKSFIDVELWCVTKRVITHLCLLLKFTKYIPAILSTHRVPQGPILTRSSEGKNVQIKPTKISDRFIVLKKTSIDLDSHKHRR